MNSDSGTSTKSKNQLMPLFLKLLIFLWHSCMETWHSWCSRKYWWNSRRLIKEGYNVHKNILDVCQNIACVVRNGKIIPSILLVWHLTSFLEGTKLGLLFSVMLYAYAVLSKESLTKMDPIACAVPPENLVHGRHV